MTLTGLTANQMRYAQGIIAAVKARGMPERCAVIAIETALDESGLQMYANGNNPASLALPHDKVGWDHGSVGLFQQQVGGAVNSTANWGTTAELMDPQTSCAKFLNVLASKNWPAMTNWQAAQAVQVSAIADGSNYEAQDARAQQIVAALWHQPAPEDDDMTSDEVTAACLLALREFDGSAEGQGRMEQADIAAITHQHLSTVRDGAVLSPTVTGSLQLTSTYLIDLVERAGKTFLAAFLGVVIPLLIASQTNVGAFSTLQFWESAATAGTAAGVAAVVSLITSILSGFKTGTASLSRSVAESAVVVDKTPYPAEHSASTGTTPSSTAGITLEPVT